MGGRAGGRWAGRQAGRQAGGRAGGQASRQVGGQVGREAEPFNSATAPTLPCRCRRVPTDPLIPLLLLPRFLAGASARGRGAGGDNVHGNLLANAVRESGDHSAINSWDRMPYIHDLGPGGAAKPTIIPLTRREHHNFILGGSGFNVVVLVGCSPPFPPAVKMVGLNSTSSLHVGGGFGGVQPRRANTSRWFGCPGVRLVYDATPRHCMPPHQRGHVLPDSMLTLAPPSPSDHDVAL